MNNKILLLFLLVSRTNLYAAENVYEFDPKMLGFSSDQTVDLSKFKNTNYIFPGKYNMALLVNNRYYQTEVNFDVFEDESGKTLICLDNKVINNIPLNEKYSKQVIFNQNGCFDENSLPGFESVINLAEQKINLKIPENYLEYSSESWDPPKLWSNGLNGFILDYNLNLNYNKQISSSQTISTSLYGVTGFNFNEWRLRADWQSSYLHTNYKNQDSNHNNEFNWNTIYAYRALKSIQADLIIGEYFLNSNLFNSFNYTGVSISSNEEMLPPNLRYYAPEVIGVARTNALVTVSQQGRILYSSQVPAGNFTIRDLPNYATGVMDVKVEEQDGSIQNYQVDSANSPYLTRPGRVRYKVVIGQPRNDHHLINETFANAEASYGLNNKTSIIGGFLTSKDYHNFNAGFGQDLDAFGAFSLNYLHSKSPKKNGSGYRFNYSKSVENTRIQATTSYFDNQYQDFSSYLNEERQFIRTTSVSLSQSFPSFRAYISSGYTRNKQLNTEKYEQFDINISKYFDFFNYKNINVNLNMYKNIGQNDYGAYLRVSLPIKTNASVSYSANASRNNNFSSNVSMFNRVSDATTYSFGVGQDDNQATATSFFTHQSDNFDTNVSASYRDKEFIGVSAGVRGGLTVTANGSDIHRVTRLGGSRLLVDTDGVPNIPISGYNVPTLSNRFGTAVTPDIRDYYRNRISVDLNKLPQNADVLDSVKTITLTQGAIGYQHYDVVSGEKGMVMLKTANGGYPAFGTEVMNEKNIITGIVGEQGRTYLTGVEPGREMKILTSGNCQIKVPKDFDFSSNADLICQ